MTSSKCKAKRAREHWTHACLRAHRQQIAKHKLRLSIYWDDPNELERICWACGGTGQKPQKCHIIPKSLGGSSGPENTIPLCPLCHDEAPDVNDQDEIWNWLASVQNVLTPFGMGRHAWLVELAQREAPYTDLTIYDVRRLRVVLDYWLHQTGLHCGQRGQGVLLKPSSMRWAAKKAIQSLVLPGQQSLF